MRPTSHPKRAPGAARSARPRSGAPRAAAQSAADPVAKNVDDIAKIEFTALHGRSKRERFAEFITRTTGRTAFAAAHAIWFAAWIIVNVGAIPGLAPFDPYPFGFLTFVVSLEAIFLSIFVLISQGRMTRHADRRAQLDLQINLLAEQESTETLSLLQRVADHLKVPPRRTGLTKPTNIQQVLSTLKDKLPPE